MLAAFSLGVAGQLSEERACSYSAINVNVNDEPVAAPLRSWRRRGISPLMGDQLLASTDVEEALSVVYASAVASSAGYVVAHRNFDRDSIDLTIEAGDNFRPKLDLQLKASIGVDDSADKMTYFCKKKNYDDLRAATQVPRILVVLRLPKDKADWIAIGRDELVLRHCAYWLSLHGYPESNNATGQTVYIPTENRFDVAGLKALMEQSRSGKIA